MRNDQDVAAVGCTIADELHAGLFEELMAQIAACFARRETRANGRAMVQGLLMELEDFNCWTIGEAVGHTGPHRLQHLLARAVWDEQQALEQAAGWVVGHLHDGGRGGGCESAGGWDAQGAVLIVDETADAKSSTDCVGAARQYSGTLGGVALCQVQVTLTLSGSRGHSLIDRRLYLPRGWSFDEELRELAGVPDELGFVTKPQLAADLLTRWHARLVHRGVRVGFVTGDEVYGTRELRSTVRGLGMGYAVAVRRDHHVSVAGGSVSVQKAVRLIPDGGWQRLRTGHGTKGTRSYDWAMLAIEPDDIPDGYHDDGHHDDGHSVLVRRHRYTRKLSFYRCWSPAPVPLARLIEVVCTRWKIEEDHQLGKQTSGLDAGQTIRWTSWHRWTALALIAYLYLTVATATQYARDQEEHLEEDGLAPITIPELLRQLRQHVLPAPCRHSAHAQNWSRWRRRHRHRAHHCHQAWHAHAEAIP